MIKATAMIDRRNLSADDIWEPTEEEVIDHMRDVVSVDVDGSTYIEYEVVEAYCL